MNNKSTLIVLLLLTVSTAVASKLGTNLSWIALLILGLSAVKFLLVAFQFMELKKAHTAWKFLIISYLVIFIGIVSIILV